MRFIATCTFGLESVLKKEIKSCGLWYEEVGDGYVAFSGEESALITSNLWLRTANKVFLELAAFPATSFEDLFSGVSALPWAQYIEEDGAFPVLVKSYKSQLSSTPACQSIVKKAIVKKLQTTYSLEQFPESGVIVETHVWIRNDQVKVLLNTSGAGLHKRGYRESQVPAPLKETLAAGLLYLSEWKADKPLYDPFCGSGTIVIEAAMMAQNIAPGHLRSFAFENWHWTDKKLSQKIRDEAASKRQSATATIIGSDYDAEAIALAKTYAQKAGVPTIAFNTQDILSANFQLPTLQSITDKPAEFVLLSNPPYGLRLGEEDEIRALYQQLGQYYREWRGASWHIFTAYLDIERDFRKEAKRRKLYNGGIQCYLYSF